MLEVVVHLGTFCLLFYKFSHIVLYSMEVGVFAVIVFVFMSQNSTFNFPSFRQRLWLYWHKKPCLTLYMDFREREYSLFSESRRITQLWNGEYRAIHKRPWLSVCFIQSSENTHVTHAHNSYHSKSSVMLPDILFSWGRKLHVGHVVWLWTQHDLLCLNSWKHSRSCAK